MKEIRRIEPRSAAMVFGILGALNGFIFSLFRLSMGAETLSGARLPMEILGFAIVGVLGGAFSALVYNLIASSFGGIRVEITEPPAPLVSDPAEGQCFYRDDESGAVRGPFTLNQLLQLVQQGTITRQTTVQVHGQVGPAGEQPELDPAFFSIGSRKP